MSPRMVHLALLFVACGPGGLGEDGRAARQRLEAALVERDPMAVSVAARAADPFRGQDPTLDRLLGDAVANVLMHPKEGLAMLEAAPQPADPAWVAAIGGAALRTGDPAVLERIRALASLPPVELHHPVVAQVSARALRDPALTWSTLQEVVAACVLLDGQPRRGRRTLDAVAPTDLPRAARALGATRVVIGRPDNPTDGDPAQPGVAYQCQTGRLVAGEAIPTPAPRDLTLGATDGQTTIYLNLHPDQGQLQVYGASLLPEGERWIQAGAELDALIGDPDPAATLRARLGPGLRAR